MNASRLPHPADRAWALSLATEGAWGEAMREAPSLTRAAAVARELLRSLDLTWHDGRSIVASPHGLVVANRRHHSEVTLTWTDVARWARNAPVRPALAVVEAPLTLFEE